MSRLAYQYVVLRCVPRVDREEFVNVGVVVYCHATDFLDVAWQVDRERLTAFDPSLDLDQVCEALAFVEGVCAGDERGGAAASAPISQRFGSSRPRAAPSCSPARCTAAPPPTRPASSSTCWRSSSPRPLSPDFWSVESGLLVDQKSGLEWPELPTRVTGCHDSTR